MNQGQTVRRGLASGYSRVTDVMERVEYHALDVPGEVSQYIGSRYLSPVYIETSRWNTLSHGT